MNASQLTANEYSPFYSTYINKAGLIDLISGIEDSFNDALSFFETIPKQKFDYRYAKGKWTIKELIQHIIDVERVFAYRALCIAREDNTPLPSFEENDYAVSSMANNRTRENLLEEYKAIKISTILLFRSFNDKMLMRVGIASGGNISVRALGFIMIGHESHHIQVIKERYL